MLNLKKVKDGNKFYWRNDWLEFYPIFRHINVSVSRHERRLHISFCFIWGQFYFRFHKKKKEIKDEPKEYGFYFYPLESKLPESFWLKIGKGTKSFEFPWTYDWIRTSALRKDGNWESEFKGNRNKDFWDQEKWKDLLYFEDFNYRYKLKNIKDYSPNCSELISNSGLNFLKDVKENKTDIQEVVATISVTEREWRQKWLKWTRFGNMVRRSLDINFSQEIGEKTGSWKGGCLGCSYEMLPNETPEQTLRRMEKERKF